MLEEHQMKFICIFHAEVVFLLIENIDARSSETSYPWMALNDSSQIVEVWTCFKVPI